MDDSILYKWMTRDTEGPKTERKEESKEETAKQDIPIDKTELSTLFKEDGELTEKQRLQKEVLIDYTRLMIGMRSAAQSERRDELMFFFADPVQFGLLMEAVKEKYGEKHELVSSLAAQTGALIIFAFMMKLKGGLGK